MDPKEYYNLELQLEFAAYAEVKGVEYIFTKVDLYETMLSIIANLPPAYTDWNHSPDGRGGLDTLCNYPNNCILNLELDTSNNLVLDYINFDSGQTHRSIYSWEVPFEEKVKSVKKYTKDLWGL